MIKWTLRVLGILVALAAVLLVAVFFYGGAIIKQGVVQVGPRVLGVPVTLEQARFYPLRGHVRLTGLHIGNPEGFHTPSLFRTSNLEIDLNVASLLSDTIVIERILIDAPQITYEAGLRGTNLGALLEKLETRADPDQPARQPAAAEPGKAVLIKELILADARAEVSATAMRGQVVPVQLTTITLNDLGGEDQSLTQIVTEVLKAVLGAVGNAVGSVGDLAGEGLKSALEGAGALTDLAGEGVQAVRDGAGEGLSAAGDTAGEGVRAVTGAITAGTSGVRGLLGGRERDDEEISEPDETEPAVESPEEPQEQD